MAYARILDRHAAEACTAGSRIVYRGVGDITGQRQPSGLTDESHVHGQPLVERGGTGCHLRFVGYLEGLLCHCHYPYTVEALDAEGPVAGFRVSMASDHEGWHHFYDVSCDYLVFDDLPEVVLIKVTPRTRKGSPADELPHVRLNHIGRTREEGGVSVFSHDPDGPYHRDQTTGPESESYNLGSLPAGDAADGFTFPGALNTPLPLTAELHVDGAPATLVALNQWHRPKRLAPLVLPPVLASARPLAGVAGSRRAGVFLLRDVAPYERRAVGTLEVRARYRLDREIELDNRSEAAVPVTLVLRDEYTYDGRSFDPDQFLALRHADGTQVPSRVHLHRARLLVPPGSSVLEHRSGSFLQYRLH